MKILAIKGDIERYDEIISFFEDIGYENKMDLDGNNEKCYYYIDPYVDYIQNDTKENLNITYKNNVLFYTIDTIKTICPFKLGDDVFVEKFNSHGKIDEINWNFADYGYFTYVVLKNKIRKERIHNLMNNSIIHSKDVGSISDGYHTFDELYEYRLLYNAAFFNELAEQGLYDVHKSKKESDGKSPFNNENMFVVMAELPTGQISNHYEMKHWNLFNVPIKDKANVWDNHTSKDVCERIRKYLFKYPKTYSDCLDILKIFGYNQVCNGYRSEDFSRLQKLLICRDAYVKLDNTNRPCIYNIGVNIDGVNIELTFPDEEMKNEFYNNFKGML